MSIRLKIILVVLPLIIVTLLLAGVTSYFSATNGITRVAKEFMDFKAYELEKYAYSQWDLLVENNLTDRPEMVLATQQGVESFARSIIRSDTEIILAVDEKGVVQMATSPIEIKPEEISFIKQAAQERKTQLLTPVLGGVERVARGFYFEPFRWYFLVTEEKSAYYRDVNKITQQTIYLLAGASIAAVLLLWILPRF
jgi:hypothetical protein